jgi:hypothetical protein
VGRVAGDLRAGQPDVVANEVDQQGSRLEVGVPLDAVDGDSDVHRPSFGF